MPLLEAARTILTDFQQVKKTGTAANMLKYGNLWPVDKGRLEPDMCTAKPPESV